MKKENNNISNCGFIPTDALRKWSTRLLLLVVMMMAIFSTRAQEKKPNVVFFLVDNTGWGDFSCYGGPTPTPRIDQLAKEGIRFTNYNVEVQCTQSRTAIMTGRHPIRCGTWSLVPRAGVKFGLAPWEYTLGKLFSDASYATALYGKWHLGNTQGRLPNDQGFDEWWGCPDSWDDAGYSQYALFNLMVKEVLAKEKVPEMLNLPPHILEGRKGQPSKVAMDLDMKVRPIVDGQYIIPKTIEFIKRNAAAKKPFFVYVGYSEMHPPMVANPEFAGKSPFRGGVYADCTAEMDYRVGQVMDALKQAGVDDNTIVIFSSDNGPGAQVGGALSGGSSGPWRGNFFDAPYEGCYRVPAIVRWPGKVPAGVVTDEMLAAVDWLPTLAGLAGSPNLVPKDRPIDGKDASAFMMGKSPTTGRESYMFFGLDSTLLSVKWRYYKMIFRHVQGPALEAVSNPYVTPQLPMIFDLSNDQHENYNLWTTEGMTHGWVFGPVLQIMAAFEMSEREYPNIPPGEEFTGYKK